MVNHNEAKEFVGEAIESTLQVVSVEELSSGKWQTEANCNTVDYQELFPENGSISATMRDACMACRVLGECAISGMIEGGVQGVRAGMSQTMFANFVSRKRDKIEKFIEKSESRIQ